MPATTALSYIVNLICRTARTIKDSAKCLLVHGALVWRQSAMTSIVTRMQWRLLASTRDVMVSPALHILLQGCHTPGDDAVSGSEGSGPRASSDSGES